MRNPKRRTIAIATAAAITLTSFSAAPVIAAPADPVKQESVKEGAGSLEFSSRRYRRHRHSGKAAAAAAFLGVAGTIAALAARDRYRRHYYAPYPYYGYYGRPYYGPRYYRHW